MFVKWPAKVKAGTEIDTPVAHIDVMPTLAAAAQAGLPEGVIIDGKNLLPLATGTGSIERKNDALFWQSGYLKVVRANDWKLIYEGKRDKHWLFNLQVDPTEQTNLVDKNPEKLAEMKAILAEHQADAIAPLYPTTTDSPIMIDKTMAERYEMGDEFVWWPN